MQAATMEDHPRNMVVCAQPEAAESGIDILRAGGNAVDAAVACALAQTVVDPLMCGIAGFGTAAVYLQGQGVHEYVDFHSPAPLAARDDMWADLVESELRDGFGFALRGRVNDLGAQSVAVPATLRGLEAMHQTHGRLPWAQVVEPAVRWAADGFFVRPGMYTFWMDAPLAGRVSNLERLAYSASGRELYCQSGGLPKHTGTPLRNPDMARALEKIAADGAQVFYTGDLAERMVADLRAQGSPIAMEDLARFQARRRGVLEGRYRDRRITTNQPPGGGAMLIQMLRILEQFDLPGLRHNSPEYIRVVSEAMKQATRDKDAYLGDPDFVDVPLDDILSDAAIQRCADGIRQGVKIDVPRMGSTTRESRDTTHLSVVDGEGNCVSITHSLGMPSGVITEGLGFMYNGCMGAFDPRPGRAGSIAPGKSRFTASCPTIVFKDDRPEIVLGAPGATQITMGVLQAILNVIDFGMPMQAAVSAPRFSATSNAIEVCNRIPRAVERALQAQDYTVLRNPYNYTIAWVHAIRVLQNGALEGGADPGRDGVAYAC
ncbi:gamma-glutamyltransferase [Ottowia sp.]|uniref:gamma-glutamyltransferase n=1 Tax=Ottowia sp. TaxID=1898956 RepID=UPI002C482E0A|nr:gamma-glutamyltransferase [Ottowia sp.]HOB67955.1 gamma-glutamyltransferase [Ottowia sp.]HPZ55764.1 gamma-glutamyltransferase [Ottowia sp.]HQD46381.1 gamma-glutamyltransferase [Ottowia sp.]